MKYKLLFSFFIFVFLFSACSTPGGETTPVQQETVPEELFSDCVGLPSDGLLHDPYGWDNLYGSKEVPAVWWQREPRDPVSRTETAISVAVSKALEKKDIWIEWALNGQMMEPIACERRANLHVDGVDRIRCLGFIPSLSSGDKVQYMICAGNDNVAEKSIGPFVFAVSSWEVFMPSLIQSEDTQIRISGHAGTVPASLVANIDDSGSIHMILSNGESGGTEGTSATIAGSDVIFYVDESGCFSLEREGVQIAAGKGFEILTDGENVHSARLTLAAEKSDQFYGFGMKYEGPKVRLLT